MKKGDIKIKRKRKSQDWLSFDPRISNDKRTFVLRVESSCKTNWMEFMMAIQSYSAEELNKLMVFEGEMQ